MYYRHLMLVLGIVTFAADYAKADQMGPQLNESIMTNQVGTTDRRRPWVASDNNGTLDIENMKVHDVVNGKAFHISMSSPDKTPAGQAPWTFKHVYIHNVEAYNINRNIPGLHIDFLKIDGMADQMPIDSDVTLDDVYFHDGNALSTLIQHGKFSCVTIRHMLVSNTTTSVQLDTMAPGTYMRNVYIEDSPDLHVALMGLYGSIGNVYVINSAGATVTDTSNVTGQKTGAHIIYETIANLPALTGPTDDGGLDLIKSTVASSPSAPSINKPSNPVTSTPVASAPKTTPVIGSTTTTLLGSTGVTTSQPPTLSISTSSVPEPSCFGLLGFAGLAFVRRSRAA